MFNTCFTVLGCPVCLNMEKAIIFANLSRKIGNKIDFVDIHQGDSRLNYLNKISPGGSYSLPKTVINEKLNTNGKLKNYMTIYSSASTIEFNINSLKLMDNNITNLY